MKNPFRAHRTPWAIVPVLLGLGATSLAATPDPSSEDEPTSAEPHVPKPRTVTAEHGDRTAIPPLEVDGMHAGRDMGAPDFVAFEPEDASIPLPVPARYGTGAEGDTLLEPASGDPFFLGFVAGNYHPPSNVSVDDTLVSSVQLDYTDGRPTQETYGFLMLERRVTKALITELEALGARVLGRHPHYNLKVAFPVASIDPLAAHPAVRWIGVQRPWQKFHPNVEVALEAQDAGRPLTVYINTFESDTMDGATSRPAASVVVMDQGVLTPLPESSPNTPRVSLSNGWQQRRLEGLGVEVLEYHPRLQAFRAELQPGALELVRGLDFVQFIEVDLPASPSHDESTPMVYSDLARASFDGSTSGVVTAGISDSGVDLAHVDLSQLWGVGWNFSGSPTGAWADGCGHGSHVTGTLLGDGSSEPGLTGNAPGLGAGPTIRLFNARVIDDSCLWGGSSVATVLSVFEKDFTDAAGNVSPRPQVANHSWRTVGGPWFGTSTDCRAIDQSTFDYGVLHVFAAGNEGPGASTLGEEPSAKNSIAVGNVMDYRNSTVGDPGTLWSSSSTGPTADLRWRPSVVAPGRWIRSVDASSGTGAVSMSGTSMAAPHVAGIAAQLADNHAFLRDAPARVQAQLLATALTRNDEALASAGASHLDRYGAGRVDAFQAHFGTSQLTWINWGFDQGPSGWAQSDFTVPVGTTRIVACMVYHEEAGPAGGSQALVNDFDLYLDQDPIDPAGNTGEWFAHQSTRDNVEIRYLDQPAPGPWRWKMFPDNASSTVHASVVVALISGSTKPTSNAILSAAPSFVTPGTPVDIDMSVTPASSMASAVFLDTFISSPVTLLGSTTTLKDGITTDLLTNPHGGFDVLLGNIAHGDTRTASWTASWTTEGVKTWTVEARSDNMVDTTLQVPVVVDGTPPTIPSNLVSTTHTPNQWSNDPDIQYTWSASVDVLSGLEGYGEFTSESPTGLPATILDLGPVTSYSDTLASTSTGWYFKLRPVDRAGNWNPGFGVAGPFLIDTEDPTPPTGVVSSSHTVGQSSCDTDVFVKWTEGTDTFSGVAATRYLWDHSPGAANPAAGTPLPPGVTFVDTPLSSSALPNYIHLWTEDAAGNFSVEAILGPFLVNDAPISIYCTSKLNSLTCEPQIGFVGSASLSASDLKITCDKVINNKTGILFWGNARAAIPFQGGFLCVQPPTSRTGAQPSKGNPPPNDCSGSYLFHWSSSFSASVGVSAGDTINAQYWMRDPASPSTTGLSNGIEVTFCP